MSDQPPGPASDGEGTASNSLLQAPGPASASPADTIRHALTRNLVEQRRVDAMTLVQVPGSVERVPAHKFDREALAAVDEWEAVGERDRQQIARLTEALAEKERHAGMIAAKCIRDLEFDLAEFYRGRAEAFREIRAVLAGEEDARP